MRNRGLIAWAARMSVVALAATFGSASSAEACPQNVNGHLGWVIFNPVTSFAWWPPGRSDALRIAASWSYLLVLPQIYQRLAPYGVRQGSPGAELTLPSNLPTNNTAISEDAIVDGIFQGLVNAHRVPEDGEVFVVMMPPNARAAEDRMTTEYTADGHHYWQNRMFPDGSTHPIVYAVVEYNSDFQETNFLLSHELFETYTDPFSVPSANGNVGLGWYDDDSDMWTANGTNPEIADMCLNKYPRQYRYWTLKNIVLSQVWLPQYCDCPTF